MEINPKSFVPSLGRGLMLLEILVKSRAGLSLSQATRQLNLPKSSVHCLLIGYRFTDHPRYVGAFRRSIATVAALPCDILLTPHAGASDFWERVARRKSSGDVAPLVDADACRIYAAAAGQGLDAQLARERTAAK